MTAKIKVTLGGATDATVLEYTDVVPFQSVGDNTPRWNLAMRCANGEDAQGTFIIDDDEGAIPKADGTRNIAAHNVVELTEDASGTEYTLFHGRISPKSVSRNEDLPFGNAIQHTITVDAPGDIRLLQLTEDWERSAETDYARLVALQAYTLNGASSTATHYSNTTTITVSSTHLAPNTNTVSMPAKTYPAGTPIRDIIQDCADSAGKIWAEVMHHSGGSHRCLLYILESDHTTYLSTVKISDDPDEIDPVASPPVIAPTWLQGSAAELDGQELITGLIVRYGSGDNFTFVESADSANDIASYDYAVDTYYDDVSVTAEQAADKGVAIVRYRSKEHVTHQPSIKIRADQVHLIAAGMSIQIKSAAAMGGQYLGTTQTRRIAQVELEPAAPEVGDTDAFYWAHLELDRALRRSPYGKGNKATTTAPKPGSNCSDVDEDVTSTL
ncbi:MAG TPA: hypothetical protein VFK56_01135, partial [Mycobacterium sp.]|nr:hypothetical protein [Mycobacterium sp.]